MAGSLTVTISNISAISVGPSRRSEAQVLSELITRSLQVMAAAHTTTITMKDLSGNVAGTLSWTPLNAS